MTVEIRRATLKDIKEILPVWGELAAFHSTLDSVFTPSTQWPREYGTYLRSIMTRDDAIAVVAKDAGEIVGYAVGRVTMLPPFFEQRYRGYIHDVFVKPQFRRRGVGRRLIDAILQWLRQQEVLLVELTVATNNEAAAFWEHLGFSVYMQQMKKNLQDDRIRSRGEAKR